MCDQDWLRHKDIIEKVIKQAEECMSEPEEEPKKKVSKDKDIYHKKNEPKPKEKKKA